MYYVIQSKASKQIGLNCDTEMESQVSPGFIAVMVKTRSIGSIGPACKLTLCIS